MEWQLEVVSKVQTKTMGEGLIHFLYCNLVSGGENLDAQGGGQTARFKVTPEQFHKVEPGDVLWFKHTTTIKEDGSEVDAF